MASITLTVNPQVWPNTTTLGIYPASNWPVPGEPEGAPVGSATDTSAVANEAVTFDGVAANTKYWVTHSSGDLTRRYVFVQTPKTASGGMGVIIHDDDEAVARPTAYLVYTWIGSVEPDNMAVNDIWVDTSA